MFEYDGKHTTGIGACWVILKSTFITPRKGVICCHSSVAILLLTWVGTACAVVQVQPVVFCSPRGGVVARHSTAQGPSLPVTRFWGLMGSHE